MQRRSNGLLWVINTVSLSRCCNLEEDRKAICMEMSQKGLTLQNLGSSHSSTLQKCFIICTLLQRITLFLILIDVAQEDEERTYLARSRGELKI